MNNDESKQTENINHNQSKTMESENNVLDNDESNQNQDTSCKNDYPQDDAAPNSQEKKRKRGRQPGQVVKKAKNKVGGTRQDGSKQKKLSATSIRAQPPALASRSNPIQQPPPAPTSSTKQPTKKSMQRKISNLQRKLDKAKEDQDKAVAKVTEQFNKKLAESNEKAGKAISNVEQWKDREIERLNQHISKLNKSKDKLKINNSATVDRLKKQIKTLEENHKEDSRRQVRAKEMAVRNEYQPQRSNYFEAMSANERLEKQLAEAKEKIERLESDQRTSKEDYSMLTKRLRKTEEQLKRTQESREKHKQDKSQANKEVKEMLKIK